MKRICRLLLLCTVLIGAVSVFPLAAESKESEVYYVNTQLLKIFPHPKGYYVIYRRAGLGTGEAFIPLEWFSPKENKADITFINTRINPYLSFFIRDGKCEYIRVSAPRDLKSSIWGLLPQPQQYDEKFEGVESLALEF
ncbi:MAG: hypothetical protein P1P65_02735 [Treponema sp.]